MNLTPLRSCFILILMNATITIHALPSFKDLFGGGQQASRTINREYPLKSDTDDGTYTLSLNNIQGTIKIAPKFNDDRVYVTATIKGHSDELRMVHINEKYEGNTIHLQTTFDKPKLQMSVDYEIIVPSKINLEIYNEKGDILVKRIDGVIDITITQQGNIAIAHANDKVNLYTKKGSITVADAHNTVQATTQTGTIDITDSYASVIAKADKGDLTVISKNVPDTATINLASISGDITLKMPRASNAHVCASTQKGSIISDLPLTIRPRVTQINPDAWKQFQKDVRGTIGTGQAKIILSSNKSNIKVMETNA